MNTIKIDPQFEPILKKITEAAKWIWLIQLFIGAPLLIAGYSLGRTHARLLLNGQRTVGTVVEVKKISFSRGKNSYTTEYVPIIEFEIDGKKIRFESTIVASSNSTGYKTQILFDQKNPERAIQDHPLLNWFPWSFFGVVGLILTIAGLNGFRRRNEPT